MKKQRKTKFFFFLENETFDPFTLGLFQGGLTWTGICDFLLLVIKRIVLGCV